jgi:hypothetical protein
MTRKLTSGGGASRDGDKKLFTDSDEPPMTVFRLSKNIYIHYAPVAWLSFLHVPTHGGPTQLHVAISTVFFAVYYLRYQSRLDWVYNKGFTPTFWRVLVGAGVALHVVFLVASPFSSSSS